MKNILWNATHETGDLSEWPSFEGQNVSHDSGKSWRPKNGVSNKISHSGLYSMEMNIHSYHWLDRLLHRKAGCRQFRYLEPQSGQDLYYGAWYYFPEAYIIKDWAMLQQFKSRPNKNAESDPVWSVQLRSNPQGQTGVVLKWKAKMTGPFIENTYEGEDYTRSLFIQQNTPIPVAKWVHLEVFLKQSDTFDGELALWQDGVQLFDLKNIRTQYPGSVPSWSVTAYGFNIQPRVFTVYVDDVTISTDKIL